MGGRELDNLERLAATTVARVLGGTVADWDGRDADDAVPDFLIELDHHTQIALEVTSSTDGRVASFTEAALGAPWPAPTLESDWHVGVRLPSGSAPPRLRDLVPVVIGILRDLEMQGVTEVTDALSQYWASPEVRDLIRLNVMVARSYGHRREPDCAQVLLTSHRGHGADVDAINRIVEKHALANLTKLLAANVDIRQLFVRIDPSTPEAEFAMHVGPPPAAPPKVVEGIDTVWVGNLGRDQHGELIIDSLWRVSSGFHWENILLGASK